MERSKKVIAALIDLKAVFDAVHGQENIGKETGRGRGE